MHILGCMQKVFLLRVNMVSMLNMQKYFAKSDKKYFYKSEKSNFAM